MRTIDGRRMLGVGMMALAVSLAGIGCAAETDPRNGDDAIHADVEDDLTPTGKPAKEAAVTMTCAQATGGCAPVGYRNVNCALSNLKANSYVVVCVQGACPSVYGMSNSKGETCFPEQKVGLDGTARAFFSVRPDATYSFTTRSGAPKAGDFIASATASVSSSVGIDTQCGGQPIGCD